MSVLDADSRFRSPLLARFREPVNGFSHLAAALVGVAAIAWLLGRCGGEPVRAASVLVYGLGMVGCFVASACHHLIRGPRALEVRLLRLDHAAIYPYIAGSYTPLCLCVLPVTGGLPLLAAVWALAGIGVLYKLRFAPEPREVSDPPPFADTLLYVAMGWLVAFQAGPLVQHAAPGSLAYAIAGGLAYSLGGLILSRRWLDFRPGLCGHHEIWHACVVLGSAGIFAFLAANL